MRYSITYSVGTNRHDEKRFVARGVTASALARRITRMQAEGKIVVGVEAETAAFA